MCKMFIALQIEYKINSWKKNFMTQISHLTTKRGSVTVRLLTRSPQEIRATAESEINTETSSRYCSSTNSCKPMSRTNKELYLPPLNSQNYAVVWLVRHLMYTAISPLFSHHAVSSQYISFKMTWYHALQTRVYMSVERSCHEMMHYIF